MDLQSEMIFATGICVLTCFGSKEIQDLSVAPFFGIKGSFKLLMASMGNLEQPAKTAESITAWHSPGPSMNNWHLFFVDYQSYTYFPGALQTFLSILVSSVTTSYQPSSLLIGYVYIFLHLPPAQVFQVKFGVPSNSNNCMILWNWCVQSGKNYLIFSVQVNYYLHYFEVEYTPEYESMHFSSELIALNIWPTRYCKL